MFKNYSFVEQRCFLINAEEGPFGYYSVLVHLLCIFLVTFVPNTRNILFSLFFFLNQIKYLTINAGQETKGCMQLTLCKSQASGRRDQSSLSR